MNKILVDKNKDDIAYEEDNNNIKQPLSQIWSDGYRKIKFLKDLMNRKKKCRT